MRKHRRFLWFLFGLGSQLQLFGTSLCFTELFVFVAAVFLVTSEWPYMKRNGIIPFFWLSIALVINGTLACLYNHTPMFGVIRGMAVVCLLPCAIIVCHWMLRKDMPNFKWSIVGGALSNFLCTFVFRRAVDVVSLAGGEIGAYTTTDIMNGPLWMISQLGTILQTYPIGWYLQCPTWLAVAVPIGVSAYALFTSVSGRSAALGALGTALFVLLGGKDSSRIRKHICRNFWLLCLIGGLAVLGFKTFYKMAAMSGRLGEVAQRKYEHQTRGGDSVVALLLGGRMESFAGLLACIDRPLVGWGPWALDTQGYRMEFLAKYGAPEDFESYVRGLTPGKVGLIPCHSHITMFWVSYGIFGLLFWIYVLWVLIRYLRQDCFAVPQWFMWLAAGVPSFLWRILFSPVGGRVGLMMFVIAVLMVRAVRKGAQPLPKDMLNEINKYSRD